MMPVPGAAGAPPPDDLPSIFRAPRLGQDQRAGATAALQLPASGVMAGDPAANVACSPVFETRRRGAVTVVRFSGELDIVSATALEDHLSAIPRRERYLIDLAGLDYLDCSCLQVLARFRQNVQSHASTVSVAGAHGMVLRILMLCDLQAWLETPDPVHHARTPYKWWRAGWRRRALFRTRNRSTRTP
jgi:anti-anti-sigma factor